MASRNQRALTLLEIMVVMTLIALMTSAVVFGGGAMVTSRVRSACTLVAGGVRVAFARSASTSKSMRLVFDLDQQVIWLEESNRPMLVTTKDKLAAGAEAATEAEKAAREETDRIIKGPTIPRALFRAVTDLGFESDDGKGARPLPAGVRVKKVEVAHRAENSQESGRAYLYFWPGGMTERAAIQIGVKDDPDNDRTMTVLVSPLTGQVQIVSGAKPMKELRNDSEREDNGL